MTLSELPKIDILMATYNGEKYIREQIESLQNQSYNNWTLLISDDGSTDNTLAIVEEMQKTDQRIEVVAQNAGFHSATKNFLSLLKVSSAPYVMFCDQDDVWLRDKIELSLTKIIELEERFEKQTPLVVFTDSRVVNEQLECISESFTATLDFDPCTITLPQFLVGNVAQGSAMILNRAIVEKVIHEDIPNPFEFHDHWIVCLAKAVGVVVYIKKPTLLYRQHQGNVAGAIKSQSFGDRLASIVRTALSRGWVKEMARSAAKPVDRACYFLASDLDITEENKKQLELLASIKEKKTFARIGIIKELNLLRNQGIYSKIYQFVSILLIGL